MVKVKVPLRCKSKVTLVSIGDMKRKMRKMTRRKRKLRNLRKAKKMITTSFFKMQTNLKELKLLKLKLKRNSFLKTLT